MTVRNAQKLIEDMLEKAGVDSPAFNSLCLMEKVCGFNQNDLIIKGNSVIDDDSLNALKSLAQRRIKGEPLQYILGQWDFYGYKFNVGEGVLIPRDDTEVVLRDCLEFLKNMKEPKVIDLCSGSGAIAVAVSKETSAQVTALEKSEKALEYLKENVKLNNADVKIIQGDIFTDMDNFADHSFDLIVSNPPYIKADEIKDLQIEISYEPEMALNGGEDGYDFYRHIIKHWHSKLRSGGKLVFEIGENQFDTIKELMESHNFVEIGGSYDLGGIQRTIYGTLK
jgi:release factor glutamine methyltransferase